jgi:hypothetical protein
VVDPSFVARLLDFAIRHIVPAGEEWLLVKTEPDFRSWWMMTVPACRYLVEGIANAALTSPRLLRGKP